MPNINKNETIEFKNVQRKNKMHQLKVSKQIPECSSDIQENAIQQD